MLLPANWGNNNASGHCEVSPGVGLPDQIQDTFFSIPKSMSLPGQRGLVGCRTTKQKVVVLIPGQGTSLGFGFGSQLGRVREAIDQCFSPPLSLPSKNK